MAVSATHRGWLTKHNEGILAGVKLGAMPGTTALGANTALDGVSFGTPVVTAIPVDSMVFSNGVASADIVHLLNDGSGNSWEYMRFDSSADLIVFNEASSDIDFRVEADGMAYAIYSDAGKNALVLGSNTDTSSADQLITVSRAARTATANTAYYDLRVAPAGAVTVPAGTTAVVATVSLVEPNVTATGTVTRAATLHIASQPTEGGTANAAIYFGAAANIACTTSLTFNDDSEDIDFRIEAADIAYAVYVDGGKNALVLGSNTDTSSADQLITVSRAARTATATVNYYDFAIAPAGAVTVPAGTTAVVATACFNEPNITATGTVTNAATVYIVAAPTEGGTGNYAFWVDAGTARFDGDITMAATASDLIVIANTAAALEVSDGTTKLMTWDTRNTVTVQNLLIDAPASQTLPDGATSQFRNVTIAAHTVTLAGTTQVTTVNQGAQLCILGATYNQSGGAVTVDQVSTLHVAVITAGASVTITANRMISTGVSDCYLTVGGVWTDTVCTQKYKQGIADLNMAVMPSLIEKIHPVSFKYNRANLGENSDFDRQRYGVIAEELPDFLRVPGEKSASVMNGTILGAFGLAAIRYLYEENKSLRAKVEALAA